MTYLISDIARVLNAEIRLVADGQVKWLLTDSRASFFPEESLFFALKTERNDGHRYVPELYKKGIRHFVISDHAYPTGTCPEANFLVVGNTLEALQKLAAVHRNQFDCPVLAITGSNGKTIVKEWLWQLLRDDVLIERSPRSYNSQIGVPLSVWQLDEQTELGIFEAGISMPGEMQRLQQIIRPDMGLITNIGAAHQENFDSLEEKTKEKIRLFASCETIVYCKDHELIDQCMTTRYPDKEKITWSLTDPDVSLFIRKKTVGKWTTEVEFHWKGQFYDMSFPFTDEASLENAFHCLTVLLVRGVPVDVIHARMPLLEPVAMRMEVKEGKNGCVIINDSYNADVNALELVLDFQARRTAGSSMKRTLILSDILQSGQSPDELYRRVADLLNRKQIDHFIGIGHELSARSYLFTMPAHFFLKTDRLLASGILDHLHQESILIKGSRSFEFETISEHLSLKIHETLLEVNLDALVHNLNYFKSLLKPTTQVVAMVKAAGYGGGALEIAKTLQTHACDVVAVAVADEGVELRHGGITLPIMVMNPEFGSFSTIFEYNLEPEIYSFKLLDTFIREAEREGVRNYPIHLKLDTGMHRLGFSEAELPVLLNRLKGQDSLRVRSVFSHLAGSDDERLDDYTQQQIALFERMTTYLSAGFSHKIWRHILNSAGIERFPAYQYDMVRLGIGLYGVSAVNQQLLQNVSSLKTTILQIRQLKAGESVGYSRKGMLLKDSSIATLPIGYADGLNRHLGNGHGEVVINGVRATIVGNICMDACMVDVTGLKAEEGDDVVIFGDELTITEMAARLNTIPYEILTSVSSRVKRVYVKE